ncbi:MAG: hypothetical protein WDN48_17135 [Pseudolabrys sp.]
MLSDFDLYSSARAITCGFTISSVRNPGAMEGVQGVAFVLWAPNANASAWSAISISGDGRRHAMRVRGNGYWEIFVPGTRARRQIQIRDRIALRPVAAAEVRSGRHSVPKCGRRPLRWWWMPDALPRPAPASPKINALDAPMSIYEVHLGSWRRKGDNGQFWLTYRDLAEQLPPIAPRWASPMSNCCRYRSIPSTAQWAISPRPCLRRPAASARRLNSR